MGDAMPRESVLRRLMFFSVIGAVLCLRGLPISAQAQVGDVTCDELTARLIEINDRILSQYEPDFCSDTGFASDPCDRFAVGPVTQTAWHDVAWAKNFIFSIDLDVDSIGIPTRWWLLRRHPMFEC
jgi:hypothetical protein